jgi:hypothetical protein
MHKMHEPRFVAYNDGGRLFFGTSELSSKSMKSSGVSFG